MPKDYRFEQRRFVIGGIAVAIVLIYIIRLFNLQIVSDDYKKYADSNALYHDVITPSRGMMYDRKGELLVYNQPAYDITVVLKEAENDTDTLELCRSLHITEDFFLERMSKIRDKRKNPGFSLYTQQLFMSQISPQDIGEFQEKLFRFPGFYISKRIIRQYKYNIAAHLFGDIAEVSPNELKKDDYYRRGDYIGKQGIERSYETKLRGEKGVEILLRDARGRLKGRYKGGEKDIKPVPGSDLVLSIDAKVQALGEYLMKDKIGSIVAIEPKTGEVICMVSSPSYSPELMVGRARSANLGALYRDAQKPLINRAIQGTYPPGSTFKPAQGLVYLQEGIIDPYTTHYACHHGFVYKNLRVGCHEHPSPLSLIPAIATSCNAFFCWGLYNLIGNKKYDSPQQALTVWKDHMVSQGFGYRLGIDIPGESRGFIPNSDYYDKAYRSRWNGLTIISIAIGQGEVLLTPLQIANLSAQISNRGYYYTPHVVKEVKGEVLDRKYTEQHRTTIDAKNYDYIVEGMRQAVLGGTCRAAAIPGIEVCGKTGTAQNRGHDHSVFMGFAPKENPKIAISVYVENGGYGAVFGVPIGSLLMEQYLTDTLSEASKARVEYIRNRTIYYGNEER
ncbi:MAG: penicillin-binding protein 2 [Bacteroidaceae bacterium]